jgi:hypothetical protein
MALNSLRPAAKGETKKITAGGTRRDSGAALRPDRGRDPSDPGQGGGPAVPPVGPAHCGPSPLGPAGTAFRARRLPVVRGSSRIPGAVSASARSTRDTSEAGTISPGAGHDEGRRRTRRDPVGLSWCPKSDEDRIVGARRPAWPAGRIPLGHLFCPLSTSVPSTFDPPGRSSGNTAYVRSPPPRRSGLAKPARRDKLSARSITL